MKTKVCVIGGGAAGMMAAYSAAKKGAIVTLFEKNEKLGKKLYITGKGRCNFTNASPMDVFYDNIVSNKKFLFSALNNFSNDDMQIFLESYGIQSKIERGNRVFPLSDHASDVTKGFKNAFKDVGVDVKLNTEVLSILTGDSLKSDKKCVMGVKLSTGKTIPYDKVIIATGGVSYPATGSTGDGIRFAEESGHEIITLRPALVPLLVKEDYIKKLQGLSLKNVTLKVFDEGKKLYDGFGELLITHFGISGPIGLSASSYITKCFNEPGKELKGEIGLKPTLSNDQLLDRIERELSGNENKAFYNAISPMLPRSIVRILPEIMSVPKDKKVNQITMEEKREFLRLLYNIPFTITGTRDFREAIITQGGVSVKDINPSTMESLKVDGLYFAGEVMDIDALTGGFNLQLAFSTGFTAGKGVMKPPEKKEKNKKKPDEIIKTKKKKNKMKRTKKIAIDGPAGAGKSTVAKIVAKELSYIYVDTGAMYRAVSKFLLDNNIPFDDEEKVKNAVGDAAVTIKYEEKKQHVYLNGEDVTDDLRTEEIGNVASKTSAYPAVRAHLLSLQKELSKEYNVVMDGRDIGTTILPDADVKIFLTASVEERAKRRYDELIDKNEEADLDKIKKDIEERDNRDMTREISPLKKADDAYLIDSSNLTIDEVVEEIKDLILN